MGQPRPLTARAAPRMAMAFPCSSVVIPRAWSSFRLAWVVKDVSDQPAVADMRQFRSHLTLLRVNSLSARPTYADTSCCTRVSRDTPDRGQ
jgi:hypothetical protein